MRHPQNFGEFLAEFADDSVRDGAKPDFADFSDEAEIVRLVTEGIGAGCRRVGPMASCD